MVDFDAWSLQTLAKFAREAADTMIRQQEQIEHLTEDLRGAVNAYRQEMKKGAAHDPGSKDETKGQAHS